MNKNLSVRSILFNNETGRYLKAINEEGLDDFVGLLATREQNKTLIIPNFSQVIQYQHDRIEKLLKSKLEEELQVKRNTVFNIWTRSKILGNQLKIPVVIEVMTKSEEVLGWIHTRLPKFKQEYMTAKDDYYGNNKNSILDKILVEIDVFLEVILCNIHATSSVDIESIKEDPIINGHCESVYEFLIEMLKREVSFYGDSFRYDSLIYQVVMENLDINPNCLLSIIGSSETVDSIKSEIYSRSSLSTTQNEHNDYSRVYSYSYPQADNLEVQRSIKLLRKIQDLSAIMDLLDRLKRGDVEFESSGNTTNAFNKQIELLANKT